jgi:SAM-dependent methyltransferase
MVKQTRVTVVRADATTLPFAQGAFDACVSQEALLHIAAKPAVLAECHRVLVRDGRLAFTDWIAFPSLADRERQRLWEWMAATTLQTLDSYRGLLGRSGFTNVEAEDLSSEWRRIVRGRIELHRALRPQREARLGQSAVPGVRPAPHVFRGAHRSRQARRRALHGDSLSAQRPKRFRRS